ncbi:MAG: ferritin family protein [Desulfobacteraceae bacterium]|nr:MAG: ferritin family protein [Desulfobacteraceae bacterium]
MSFESFEEIINFAIDKEKEAVAFYEDVSTQEPYSGGKKMFEEFAQEERKHQALLENFLKGETKLADYKFKWIPDMKRGDYLVDLNYEKGMHYTDILRLAMKREEKALHLYNHLATKTDKDELINIFKMLSQEEAKHKLALETLYDDYMAEMGD